jgi:hypothetical protein
MVNASNRSRLIGTAIALVLIHELRANQMSPQQHFDRNARQWEDWCESVAFDARLSLRLEHDSFRELASMGEQAVPMIFSRWGQSAEKVPTSITRNPPWWLLLERITGKKMISDAEKLQGIPDSVKAKTTPADVDIPPLQQKRWLEWWKSEKLSGKWDKSN